MRPYFLAAKVAGVFLFVMTLVVAAALHVFSDMVKNPEVHGGPFSFEGHHIFVSHVLKIWLVAAVLMVAFSISVTAPLRRMSRSMDRIAAGDLEHRVVVKGRDEGAAMGRSFNAMAERVQTMIVGQKELMAGVSHELRSPLARIKLSLELLREGRGGFERGVERIQDLEIEVDALDGLVEELLLASRIDLGAVAPKCESLNLEDLCREAWQRVEDAATTQEMTLNLQLDDVPEVVVDRVLTVRLLGNLFENSVRYAASGEVAVVAQRQDDRLQVTVRDEGPGVDSNDLERLFEPFFRADRARPHVSGANGLGLMIVRRAVEAHGGTVSARNASPRGLEVRFDLPIWKK